VRDGREPTRDPACVVRGRLSRRPRQRPTACSGEQGLRPDLGAGLSRAIPVNDVAQEGRCAPRGGRRARYVTSGGGPLTQDPKEAFKTEPDKNVYLVLGGHHYLFQGHEGGPQGYVTRIDLDEKNPAVRVSLVADTDVDGKKLPNLDGITWNPFTRQLLLTAEARYPNGGVWAVTLDDSGNEEAGKAVRLPA